jgi:hypothetical protein
MTAQTLVLNYVRTPAHFEALWFASIANNILWWTFVKACTRTLVGLFGAPSLLVLLHLAVEYPCSNQDLRPPLVLLWQLRCVSFP